MKPWLKILITIAVPVIVLILLFRWNLWVGLAGLAVLLFIIVYQLRAVYYSVQANGLYAKQDWKGAAEHFGKAYQLGKRPGFLISQAFVLLKAGEPAEAARLLEQVMSKPLNRGEDMNAKVNYALASWMLGRQEEAVRMMEDIYPSYKTSIVYGNLGLFYVMRGELTRALEFNREAYEYNDADKTILDNLGLTYFMLGRYEEAKEIYEKLMALKPTFAEAYYYFGLTLRQLGDAERSLEVMRQGLAYEPSMITSVRREMLEEQISAWESDAGSR
ncbi:tetratricopeptide repeat protein [Paenibacillus sp. GD4]|uniref:tetratricopeptide repeat protein n=1 Tax=Paenibacillus sp. GD4 TaxID=3068890 RepID=UPI002796BC6B|nr:tetratricopeptide repeat protein [Paenibacillus sp. GD4]MDQ1912784.1 tetratricopeptide repeat protein [Paenibacillus sp. GD4]